MTAKTARRFRTAIMIMMVCIPVSLGYEFIDSVIDEDVEGKISFVGLAIGIILAMPLALLEESRFDERMRRLPFSVAVLAKSLTYIGSLVVVFQSVGLIFGWMEGLTMADYWESFTEPDLYLQMGAGFVLYVIIVFFRQLDRLFGPGVLLRYLLGRYHRPRREARIFMFLDVARGTAGPRDLPSFHQRVLQGHLRAGPRQRW